MSPSPARPRAHSRRGEGASVDRGRTLSIFHFGLLDTKSKGSVLHLQHVACMSKAYTFRLDPELIARVDRARGDVNRTRFVQRALESAVESAPVVCSCGATGFGDERARRHGAECLFAPPVYAPSRAPVEKESANLATVGDSKVAKADRGGSPAPSRPAPAEIPLPKIARRK